MNRRILLPHHPIAEKLEHVEELLLELGVQISVTAQGALCITADEAPGITYLLENESDSLEGSQVLPRSITEEVLVYYT